MKICCITLKYSKPDIFSEIVSFGQEARKNGHEVSYILSKHCRWLVAEFPDDLKTYYLGKSIDSKSMVADTISFYTCERLRIGNIFDQLRCDVLFFGNMHPANRYLATIARRRGCNEIWWWLHEPYRENKNKYGWWKQYYYTFAESFQPAFLKLVDLVILSSRGAVEAFRRHFSWYRGEIVQVPLILRDYFDPFSDIEPKYITFVGSAVYAKGIDIFFELLEYVVSKKLSLQFQIVTSTEITKLVESLSSEARSRLKIVSGHQLSDQILGQAVRNSLVVLTPYRSTMQSGVVPAAFMHGVPVITTNVGSMGEFVRPGETGLLLKPNASFSQWLDSIEQVRRERKALGENCRTFYKEHHSPQVWQKFFPLMFS